MAKVIPIGEPVNDAERLAIAHLRDNLPESYLILHNFEVVRGGEYFEVDVAVVTPHAVYLVDVKGTRGLIGVRELGLMKESALLVNTSRGPIVEEAALIEAMRSGRIAGAALDVYDTEPLPADHPLRGLRNTLLTPHTGYVTAENLTLMYGQAVEDIAAWLDGAPVRVLNG